MSDTDTPIEIGEWQHSEPETLLETRVFSVRRHHAVSPNDAAKSGEFFYLDTADWVNVIAVTAADQVVLIEQFRIGAYAAGLKPWLVEPVAGIVEPGETPEAVARRETVEEAGCEIAELEPIGTVMSSPGGCSELLHLYCGRVDSDGVGGIHGLEHEQEDIRAFVLPLDDALKRMAMSEYNNASTVITLQWLALNRERLKKKWS